MPPISGGRRSPGVAVPGHERELAGRPLVAVEHEVRARPSPISPVPPPSVGHAAALGTSSRWVAVGQGGAAGRAVEHEVRALGSAAVERALAAFRAMPLL
ncbi:hypothetical protein WMF28_01920 [Sorangium sp. So ce590]|uniref:hypothetical protein n=1 Tax=Sorangium sp. So ce590 TaxID=3133317 RepID=UPI003F5F2C0E